MQQTFAGTGRPEIQRGLGGPHAARTAAYAFFFGLVFWAALLFAIAIGTTLAYRFIGGRWEKSTLGYTADPAVMGYTESGMNAWASVADIKPVKGGSDIEVVIAPLLAPIYYPGQPAQANVTQPNGRITHCEVRLDPTAFTALNEASRAATVVHELGHCLGLDHSDQVSIMMNPYFYEFGADDAAGAIALFGPAHPADDVAENAQAASSDAGAATAPRTYATLNRYFRGWRVRS